MRVCRRHMLILLGALIALPVHVALADDHGADDHGKSHDDDHGREHYDQAAADEARRSGEIRPLQEILADVQKSHPGDVVGVLFGKENGVWVYEFKVLQADGRYVEVYVDAKTKQVIKIEGK